MEIKVLNNGNTKVLTMNFAPADGFVSGEALYLSKTPIKGILGSSVQDGQVQFVCMNGIALGERLRQPMSKVQYLLIMQQFAAIVRDIKSLNLSVEKLLLDFRYIFINESTWELQLAYTPCTAKANANNLIGFLSAISAMTKPFREADMEYAQRFPAFLKTMDEFDYTRVEQYILKEDAKVVEAINKSHPPKNVSNNVQSAKAVQPTPSAPVTQEPIIKAVNINQVPEIDIADMMEDDIVTEEKVHPVPVAQPEIKPVVPVAQPVVAPSVVDEEANTSLLVEEDFLDNNDNEPALVKDEPVAPVNPVSQPIDFGNIELDDTSLLVEDDIAEAKNESKSADDGFVFRPDPAPQPVVKPVSQPVAQPVPAPQPVAQPVPTPQPVVKPAYELKSDELKQKTKSVPAPQPVVKPASQPMAQPVPAPQPVVKPAPQPMAQPVPAPQPVVKPAPQPMAQPVPAPQPVVKPAPQPMAQPVPAPQPVVKPAPQPMAQPVPAPQPVVKPAPQPVAQPVKATNFYEDNTALLTDEPFAPMDTYSGQPAPAKEYVKYPTLKRVFNGDVVKISKPVFRIGKERSYVDYFVSNSNVISRSHADIIVRDNRYFVIDLNSKNKTYVNGRMIMPNCEIEIFDGDTITLANEDFLFKV